MVYKRKEWWDGDKCALAFRYAEKFGGYYWALTRMPASRAKHVESYATKRSGRSSPLTLLGRTAANTDRREEDRTEIHGAEYHSRVSKL